MIKAVAIEIGFSEHPGHTFPRRFDGPSCWIDAQRYLNGLVCSIKRDLLGYYKTDFLIEWQDGSAPYQGRLDLVHPDNQDRADHNLRKHVNQFVSFHAGRTRPAHISEAQHRIVIGRQSEGLTAYYANLLDNYDIGLTPA